MEHEQALAGLSDEQLIDAIDRIASVERVATADLVAALAEFDARRLHLPLGYSSLFAYCVQHLRLSEDATFNRIEAARASRRFPTILAKLKDGGSFPSVTPSRRAVVAPLLEAHYKLQVTISASAHARLRRVQDLMRHVQPNGDPAVIVERALETLERELLRRKAADVARPRSSTDGEAHGRHVPSGVKRQVWRRDGARCAFRREDGRRCDATGLLEFHHVVPYAHGGETSAANLELRCRAHNGFEWDRLAGEDKPAVTTTGAGF